MLQATGIVRRAAAGRTLLDDLSLTLSEGDRLALRGPSGAGKSLLLRALVLLDPLDAGRVEWHRVPLRGDAIPQYRRRVIYLQQNAWVSKGDVAAQLAVPWSFSTSRKRTLDRSRAEALFARTGRGLDFMEQQASELSGGEAQLVALARALLLEPTVLLLDEPTSAMDESTRIAAETLLEEWIQARTERAWIWVSHDSAQLVRTCRRSLELDRGRAKA